jgi:tRNA dimethylallyltransferase
VAAKRPLIVIVGPTASGKTGLAVKVAKKFGGEIISADSRAIYREMNIGTAKPTLAEQGGIPHHGLDLVAPNERFTVADFKKYAEQKIAEIRARGKMPLLVGGSGLYVDSVLFNYDFGADVDEEKRQKLNKMTVAELQNYCEKHNISLPENHKNKRYLIRAIEQQNVVKNNRQKMRDDAVIVGITTDKDELLKRIENRAEQMFRGELYDETKRLAAKYSFDLESMKSNIYPIVHRMLGGEITRDEAKNLSVTDDWHLAKKQMTWFRRNPAIKWLLRCEIEKYLDGLFTEHKM